LQKTPPCIVSSLFIFPIPSHYLFYFVIHLFFYFFLGMELTNDPANSGRPDAVSSDQGQGREVRSRGGAGASELGHGEMGEG
jgi:hypothetical protein